MAYPDYGAFLPTEALYTEPGAYSGVLKGEALKRASYLSDMDRFYEELKESSERFEKQYALTERELDFTEDGKESSLKDKLKNRRVWRRQDLRMRNLWVA
jgi:hypothetical protein